jgi:3-deoxy-D-manno-octulosonic-acid transferase
MTENSFRRYRRFPRIFKAILKSVRVLAMAAPDARRFAELGAGTVEVSGNLKLDAAGTMDDRDLAALKLSINAGSRPVFIAGSVREGEEAMVVDAILRAASRVPGLYSIIAPRHTDRIECIARMADGLGIRWGLRSAGPADVDLLIIDTMGELFGLYGISDAAFVGGSLIDLGGQNILEPIVWGVPTIHGPHMDNFTWALEVVQGTTIEVNDARELGNAVADVILDEGIRAKGRQARAALEKARGVTQRYFRALEPFLSN